MLEITIPGREPMQLTTLISDVNGTLAVDGLLMDAVIPLFKDLQKSLEVFLLSADTLGTGAAIAQTLGVKFHRLDAGNEIEQKAAFLRPFGSEHCIAIGQGTNDEQMLRNAGLGICVFSTEGCAPATLLAADIVVPDITAALQLLQHPKRILATLRK